MDTPKNFTTIQLRGGLGNQLFQYSFGKCLELSHGRQVTFDNRNYVYPFIRQDRALEVDKFIDLPILEIEPVVRFLTRFQAHLKHFSLISNLYKKMLIIIDNKLKSRSYTFMDEYLFDFASIPDRSIYLLGDFTSCKYHRDNTAEIHNLIRSAMCAKFHSGTYKLGEKTVGIHVRRGDYVKSNKTRDFHGYCDTNFYIESLKSLMKRFEITNVYLASDDFDMCKDIEFQIRALGLGYSQIELDPASTMHALSHFPYFIGSNSTFSWWVGALAIGQKSIFPQKWFKNEQHNFDIQTYFSFRHELMQNELI
jgi:hypothetical protein